MNSLVAAVPGRPLAPLLKEERGTRCLALVAHLAEQRIAVEMNPISNVCTGVVESVAAHPAKHYLEQGMLVCVNTDDPKMFHNTMTDEFWELESQLGMTRDDVRTLILNGVEASWLPDEQKRALAAEIQSDKAWAR